jgi:hypothetical protein
VLATRRSPCLVTVDEVRPKVASPARIGGSGVLGIRPSRDGRSRWADAVAAIAVLIAGRTAGYAWAACPGEAATVAL